MSEPRRKPSLSDFKKKSKYSPNFEIPDDFKANIVFCDTLQNEDDYRDQLESVPINDEFPEFNFGYDDDLYANDKDKKALMKASEIARTEELNKRKERKKIFTEIYEELLQKHIEEQKDIQNLQKRERDEKKDQETEKTKKILFNSVINNQEDETEDSDDISSDDDISVQSSSSNQNSEDEAPRSQPKKSKSSKHVKNAKETKKQQRHSIDSELQYELVKDGKVTTLGFISDVLKKQKEHLEELNLLKHDNPHDEDVNSKIKEQEERVKFLQNKLDEQNRIPDDIIIAPKVDPQNEIYQKHLDTYQRLREKAKKEIEQDKLEKQQSEKLTSDSRASAIDQTVKDLFGDSDDSGSDIDLS